MVKSADSMPVCHRYHHSLSQSTMANTVWCGCCGQKVTRAKERRHRSRIQQADMVLTPPEPQATPSQSRLPRRRISPYTLRPSPYKSRLTSSRPQLSGTFAETTERVGRPAKERQRCRQGMSVVHPQSLCIIEVSYSKICPHRRFTE
jgi:hypothetical protein